MRHLLASLLCLFFLASSSHAIQATTDKRYVIVKDNAAFQVDSKYVATAREGAVVIVDSIHGDWLWVGSHAAYLAKADAVPLAEALQNLSKNIESDKSVNHYYRRARLYRAIGDLPKALADVQQALQKSSENLELLLFQGMVQIDLKAFNDAHQSFTTILSIVEKNPKEQTLIDYQLANGSNLQVNARVLALNNRGWSLTEQGKFEEALSDYDRASLLDPSYARAFLNRAITYDRMGKADQAIEEYGELIRLLPEYSRAYFNRGRVRFAKGDVDGAIADYSEAIQRDPQFSRAYHHRRIAWETKGDWEKLLQELTAQVQSRTASVDSVNALAWLYATCPNDQYRNGKQAVVLAEKACEATESKLPGLLDTLAAAYAEAGRFPDAVQTQKKALTLATEEQKVSYQVRLALYEQGKPFRATQTP